MAGAHAHGYEGYAAVAVAAALELRADGGLIRVSGKDAVSFLHGVLTNDVAALSAGQGCYAAYLTPQGRMLADMHVLRREDDLLLVLEPGVAPSVARRFDQSVFTEDVQIEDRSAEVRSIALHGPTSHGLVAGALEHAVKPDGLTESLSKGAHVTVRGAAGDLVVFAEHPLGQPGVRVVGAPEDVRALQERITGIPMPILGPAALTARRIEAGTPIFGIDMTTDTIPLEAGIESRAISTTKGCYVGQEIIVRILHRAHGRVARRLMGLVSEGDTPIAPGASIHAEGREVGIVTSAAWSPDLGAPIALAMLHRDAFEPGTTVTIGSAAGTRATVRALPLRQVQE